MQNQSQAVTAAIAEHYVLDDAIDSIPVNSGEIKNDGYIVSKLYDWIWFIGAPTIGLITAFILLFTGVAEIEIELSEDHHYSLFDLSMSVFLTGHLVLVFFRSHGNSKIFALHPIRFTLIPILLLIYMNYSATGILYLYVIAFLWDAHHSAAQTFGLGRIYDMRMGNHQQVGRRLDYFLNLFIWVGPILAGASLIDYSNTFFNDLLYPAGFEMKELPTTVYNHKSDITKLVFVIGIPLLAYYLFEYWKYYKRGYLISVNKVVLYVTTALISIFSWGFNTLGEAFFVMNFFHAWQYFAIVWAFEKKSITNIFRLSKFKNGKYFSIFLLIIIGFTYGLWGTIAGDSDSKFSHSLILTVSLLHFWYDGFIWSVKRQQV
nr:hypothetical protein [Cytophagales bacterium]